VPARLRIHQQPIGNGQAGDYGEGQKFPRGLQLFRQLQALYYQIGEVVKPEQCVRAVLCSQAVCLAVRWLVVAVAMVEK
jgi:hypothetical protein